MPLYKRSEVVTAYQFERGIELREKWIRYYGDNSPDYRYSICISGKEVYGREGDYAVKFDYGKRNIEWQLWQKEEFEKLYKPYNPPEGLDRP